MGSAARVGSRMRSGTYWKSMPTKFTNYATRETSSSKDIKRWPKPNLKYPRASPCPHQPRLRKGLCAITNRKAVGNIWKSLNPAITDNKPTRGRNSNLDSKTLWLPESQCRRLMTTLEILEEIIQAISISLSCFTTTIIKKMHTMMMRSCSCQRARLQTQGTAMMSQTACC